MHYPCAAFTVTARKNLLPIVSLLFLLLALPVKAQSPDLKDLKKEADRRYEEEDYGGAYKLYAQLVSNFPKDPVYNFRLGVCMIYGEPDKKKCLPYLKNAAASEDAQKEADFFLGKAYHINYRFDDAIRQYNTFKEKAPAALQKKFQVDREIAACQNGKRLLSNMSDLVVQNKKVLNEADYFRSYDLRNIGGKLLVKPEEFKTSLDKKKKDHSVVFLPRSGERVYFSSYGDRGENGRDLFSALRLPGGGFGKPEPVSGVNTPFDDDYPFLHPDGKTLYFASKGHNSMGGYDIFRSVYSEGNGTWSQPVNLEFPINSPDDDFLFVTDSLQETACFSTGRQSTHGKIDVLKIKTERKPMDILVLAGTVEPETEKQSVESTITVKDVASDKTVGMFVAEPNGDYNMELPNGAKLLFMVGTPGLKTQSQEVTLPLAQASSTFRQTITYEKGKLKIISDFTPGSAEDNYLKYLGVIEKKAKLDVNEGENKLEMPLAGTGKGTGTSGEKETTSRPTVVDDGTPVSTAGLDNRALATMARKDAEESQQEAAQLDKDAEDAMRTGKEQKLAADRKLSEAAEEIKAAANITDADLRTEAIAISEKKKEDAKSEQIIADKVIGLARSLEEDAKTKKQQAILNRQYADELDKVVISGNPASLKKLEDLRQQIEELDENKGVAQRIEDNKNAIAQKEEQSTLLETQSDRLRADLDENAKAIIAKEEELGKTRKKSKKAEINAQLDNLKAERIEKEKELNENDAELAALKEDIASLQQELAVAGKVGAGAQKEKRPDALAVTEKTARPASTSPPRNTATSPTVQTDPADLISTTDETKAREGLENLSRRLDAYTPPAAPGGNFTDPSAKGSASEAGALLARLNEAREWLKDDIAAARSAIISGGPDPAGPDRAATLSAEAEEILTGAQKLRAEARDATGEEKDRKNAEAKQMEDLANDKLIGAAKITAEVNQREFATGSANLEKLIANGKGSQSDREQALMLSGEAELALSQAAELRAEAATLNTKGAQLGSLSNAEEKEAEALLKQRQAVDLLKSFNPEVVLATATPPTSKGDVTAPVAAVNKGITELNALTAETYNKIFEANDAELSNLRNALSASELTAREDAERDLTEALNLRDKAGSAKGDERSGLLLAAIKKQEDGLAKFQKLKKELDEAIASNERQKASQKIAAAGNVSKEKTNTQVASTNTVTTEKTATTNTGGRDRPAAAATSTLQNYFAANKPALADEASRGAFNAALSDLASTDKELEQLGKSGNSESSTVAELRSASEELLNEAERLGKEAQGTRSAANSLPESQKETALKRAAELEERAQEKQLSSAALVQRANHALIAANDSSISELLTRLKNDDPTAAGAIETQAADLSVERDQASELRKEAEGLSNPAQKLGGMSNADERESDLIQKQEDVIRALKEKYPDYSQPEVTVKGAEDLASRRTALEEKQVASLGKLNKALQDAYSTSEKNAATKLTPAQQKIRQEATAKQARSLKLFDEADNSNDLDVKSGKLAESARLAGEALAAVNKLPVAQPAVAVNNRNNTETEKENKAPAPAVKPAKTPATTKATARIEGLEVIRGNAYNPSRPIPINAPIGQGLTFRVQIGAFRSQLPNDAFRGLSPLNGETTTNGYYRYTAGNFNKVENANAVRNDLRKLGYGDAFVVAYYNGKRISLAEALELMAKEGRTIDVNAPVTAGITENTNIPKPGVLAAALPVKVSKELESTNGLLFTIQIGVYNKQVSAQQLFNLLPVYREQLGNGLYRYTAGIYNNADRLMADRQKVVNMGIRDAFVSAYINGKRVPFAEARSRQQSDKSIKPEAENPIVFPGASTQPASASPDVRPFTNNIKSYPAASAANGVKANEQGVSFKVQIGAFSRQVPEEIAAKFSQIRTWPVEFKQLNNLFVYNIGNFTEARYARALRDEAVKLGISDAFVTAYRDGKKLYGADAAALLSR